MLKLAFGLNHRRGRNIWKTPRAGSVPAALRAQAPEPLIACWRSLTAADYRDVLGRIDVPAMLVYGGKATLPSETARYVADRIPNALLHIYEGTDHSPISGSANACSRPARLHRCLAKPGLSRSR